MKICIISQDFAPAIGGVAAHVDNLSKALAAKGHRVIVATIRYDFKVPFRKLDGGREILRFWVPDVSKLRGMIFIAQAAPILFLLGILRGFEVVHWHNILPDTIVAWAIPARRGVFTNHTSTFLEMHANNRHRRAFRLLMARAAKIIGPSRELTEKSISFFGRSSKGVHYIPNGIDIGLFTPLDPATTASERREWLAGKSLPPSTRIIFCPRRLEPKNGVMFIVQAMPGILKKFPDAVLLIAGNDAVPEYAQNVRDLISDLGLEDRIKLLGPVSNDSMLTYHRLSEVTVLPSLMEATSIAGLEAMATGTPLVGTKVGGIPEIIDDGVTGLLVLPSDPVALGDAVGRLLSDEALRRKMSIVARLRTENEFSWDRIAARTAEVYLEQ